MSTLKMLEIRRDKLEAILNAFRDSYKIMINSDKADKCSIDHAKEEIYRAEGSLWAMDEAIECIKGFHTTPTIDDQLNICDEYCLHVRNIHGVYEDRKNFNPVGNMRRRMMGIKEVDCDLQK